jgi:DNA-binding transcriptional ArsR family regulator
MKRGGSPMDRGALAPLIAHPTRRSIVDALVRRGPLSASELGSAIDGPRLCPARLNYHVSVLIEGGALIAARQQTLGRPSLEILYSLTHRR